MASLLADTHALVWYLAGSPRLSNSARVAMREAIDQGHPLLISSITLVELTYLIEKGRLDAEVRRRVMAVLGQEESGIGVVPFDLEAADALERIPRDTVPDMPDRMIAATALALALPLVTADERIRQAPVQTIW